MIGNFSRIIGTLSPKLNSPISFSSRGFRHYIGMNVDDISLPGESMPDDVEDLMKRDPNYMNMVDEYWYWRIRGESTLLDPEALPKKSYKDLARDMGLVLATRPAQHLYGLIELYEYLKMSPMLGPFGTVQNPVLIPAMNIERTACCTGSSGDEEHRPLYFRCREGFLYRCGECDQIFMLARIRYESGINVTDPQTGKFVEEDTDIFDIDKLKAANDRWNRKSTGVVQWPIGYQAVDALLGCGVLPGMKEWRTWIT